MSLRDTEMHVVSLCGAGLIAAALTLPLAMFTESKADTGGALRDDRIVIEASIAYRKQEQKQPQKVRSNPEPEKVEGVSRDENKKVEDKKEEKKPPEQKSDPNNPFGKFARPTEDVGKPTTNPDGDFNGDEKGFAPVSKGDPFFGRLHRDMNFQPPEIAKGTSVPEGCIRITPEGKIKDITFAPPIGKSGDDDIQTAAEAALQQLKKIRNDNPEEVPTRFLDITKQWLCFKFTVTSP